MLKKYKQYPPQKLAEKIRELDDKFITPESADTLLEKIPDMDEINKFKTYNGPIDILDLPSRYYYEVS